MKLTPAQVATFEEEGYLFLPSVFSAEEMELLTGEMPGMFAQERPEVIREKGFRRAALGLLCADLESGL